MTRLLDRFVHSCEAGVTKFDVMMSEMDWPTLFLTLGAIQCYTSMAFISFATMIN